MENRNYLNRFMVLLLAVMLVFTMLPIMGSQNAYADTDAPFTITVDGTEIQAADIEKAEKAYAYFDYMANETLYYDLYTVKVESGATEATLKFGDKECIVYNYDGSGNYLAGWLDDPTKGTAEITVKTDSDANGALDYIQVQNPYNADWTGGELLYAVTFDGGDGSEPILISPNPNGDAEDEKETVQGILLNAGVTTKAVLTATKNVKVTYTLDNTTKEVIQELKDMGYTVKYQYYRSTKKNSGYVLKKTTTGKAYVNTAGTKGKTYYYKVRLAVYKDGKLIAKSALPLTASASKKWAK